MHLLMHGCTSQQEIVFLAALKAVAISLSLFCFFFFTELTLLPRFTGIVPNDSKKLQLFLLFKSISLWRLQDAYIVQDGFLSLLYLSQNAYVCYVPVYPLCASWNATRWVRGNSWGKIYWLLLLSIVTLAASA